MQTLLKCCYIEMESSQWENLNHLFCRKVSFLTGPRCQFQGICQGRLRMEAGCRLFDFSCFRHFVLKCLYQVRVITVFTVFRLLTDFVCLYNYEF
jgi:hypothetical protein